MASFTVIGITDSPQPFIAAEAMAIIRRARVFSGGRRHHSIVKDLLPSGSEWIDITAPLDNVFAQYARYDSDIVVFASGDPLFFGFANTIRRRLPDATLTLFPSFNSLQALAHRLLIPYDDMRIVSLTGRPWHEFDRALIECATKIGILTDHEHNPAAIAARMASYGYSGYEMFVGEHLGNPAAERISHIDVATAMVDVGAVTDLGSQMPNQLPLSEFSFGYPNCAILKAIGEHSRRFGIPDGEFSLLDGRERMITKMPIRLLTLQALELSRSNVFWDIGFCTGSVSIEARLQFPRVQVVAFEVRPEGERLMQDNAHHLGAPGITTVMGDFLGADLESLPLPDAVFIGGHGGHLNEMMARIVPLLRKGGRIVMNSVTESSHQAFVAAAQALALTLHEEERVSLNDYNPITILKATK